MGCHLLLVMLVFGFSFFLTSFLCFLSLSVSSMSLKVMHVYLTLGNVHRPQGSSCSWCFARLISSSSVRIWTNPSSAFQTWTLHFFCNFGQSESIQWVCSGFLVCWGFYPLLLLSTENPCGWPYCQFFQFPLFFTFAISRFFLDLEIRMQKAPLLPVVDSVLGLAGFRYFVNQCSGHHHYKFLHK